MNTIPLSFTLSGKSADFLLAASVTKTCEIEGITQAGIPGLIHLTPTLDAEFIVNKAVFSLGEIAETPKGVPTPALITRAAQELRPFAQLKILNLGLEVIPQQCEIEHFNILPSQRIDHGANINALELFEKGRRFGQSYLPKGDYVILGESTPSGTTTAQASVQTLGCHTQNSFASSFKHNPSTIKSEVITKALDKLEGSTLDRLGHVSDNMLIFCAGFMIEASKRFPLVLAGGTQMAAALLIADRLAKELDLTLFSDDLYIMTTQWVALDDNSDIDSLLAQLSFEVKNYYAPFDFSLSSHPALKLYDEGEAKEGVGAGAALAYMLSNGIDAQTITSKVESFLG